MGVFIYKTKGSFPNNFVMEAVDVLLMAKGSAAEVGYKTDAELIGDLCDLNYEEYSRALIHCHNFMATSFSGTDYEQLKLAASTGPYYLSVVVNNDMEFTAKVAIKSTEKYKGFSFFKNLSGKEIKSAKELTKESYEIIDVKVELEYPQYMLDVDDRIKKRLQSYVTPTFNSPVGSGNKVYSPGTTPARDYRESMYSSRDFYSQTELFPVTKKEVLTEDDLEDFVEEALEMYCNPMGYFFNNELCVNNILEDKEHYGIPLSDYIKYLETNILINETRDREIIKLLKEYVVYGK